MASLDYDTLHVLQKEHPSWRLLRSDHAPLVVSFLSRVFIQPNVRLMAEADLAEALEDDLFVLRERLGNDSFPRSARDYLSDWSSPAKGWLRKFYPRGTDEPSYDLVPAVERVIAWLGELEARSFVGTESRLLLLFDLLRQMATGSQSDPEARVAELQKRRDEIDAEIARTLAGNVAVLDDTAIRDRFQQFTHIARDLLSDFREVEQNFRLLDRSVRERIALWEGGKAALLDEIMGRKDAIDDSDQGRSFRAFWDFLMSDSRQQELTHLLDTILEHPAVASTEPDPRLRRVHSSAPSPIYQNNSAVSSTIRRGWKTAASWTCCAASRRNPCPCANRRRPHPRSWKCARLPPPSRCPSSARCIRLPSSPRWPPPSSPASHIRHSLRDASQVTLRQLVQSRPPEHGLAEIIAYLEIAHASFTITVDESAEDVLEWSGMTEDGSPIQKSARLPRVIFVR
ncbi:MAG: DUF3375 domain-containing protein [Akkermansiaceae bacterium]|nr:DUF3375 domain-containing protein [Akkermansiaceae bacterium]